MPLRPTLIELVVADMATTLAFYRKLGLAIPEDVDTSQPHLDFEFAGGVRIAFDTQEVIRSIDPEWTPPTGGHRAALAWECDSPGAVDAAWAELTAAGCEGHKEPWDAFWGMRYAILRDPDGTPVDLYAYLPS